MTAAFQDFTGGASGFTSDSEGASANLDITMSDQSARNLWDVQAAVQQIATDFQTAVRAASDFNSYLISIRETSQTIKMPNLGMEPSESGNMSYSGGRVDSGSVYAGAASEMGMASRVAEMEDNAAGGGVSGGVMGSRLPNGGTFDFGGWMSQMSNTAWMLSFPHGHGMFGAGGGQGSSGRYQDPNYDPRYAENGGRPPQYPPPEHSGGPAPVPRSARGGRVSNVLNRFGTASMFAQGIRQGAPVAEEAISRGAPGAASGAMGLLGRAGLYGAAAYGVYQVADAGVQAYAESRAMAIASNNSSNGVGWGLAQRFGEAQMAASPFISSEDAQAIYSSAIDMGFASTPGGFRGVGDFSNAVNFMYDANKDYGINPQQSAALLHSATTASESVGALAEQLLTLKNTLDGTGMSLSVAGAAFQSYQGQLIASGADPRAAANVATGTIKAFAGNNALGPDASGVGIVQNLLGNFNVQAMLGSLHGELPAQTLMGQGAVQASSDLQNFVAQMAAQVKAGPGSDDAKKALFYSEFTARFPNSGINVNQAMNLYDLANSDPTFLSDAIAKAQQTTMGGLQHRNGWQNFASSLQHADNTMAKWFGFNTQDSTVAGRQADASMINTYSNYNDYVNKILNTAGDKLGQVTLYGPDGKPVMADGTQVAGSDIAKWMSDSANFAKFSDVSKGYYIKDATGTTYNANNITTGGVGGMPAGSNANNTVYIQLSPQAQQYLSANPSSLNLSTGASVANTGN